jgi:hypothetical protein
MKKWLIPGGVSVLLFAANAQAEESPYCKKTQARASSEAATLFSPSLAVQGVKPPNNGDIDGSGIFRSRDLQLRVALSLSPLDMYKGTLVLKAGEADCVRQTSEEALKEALAFGAEIGRVEALKKQAAQIRAARPRIDGAVKHAEERYAAQLATTFQVSEVKLKASQIERKAAEIDTQIARLEARGYRAPVAPLPQLVASYEAGAMTMEKETSRLRNLAPWNVALRGGVIPGERVDAFGVIEISYNFGGLVRLGAESRYLEAREKELKTSRTELRTQIDVLMRELDASLEHENRELATVERQLESLIKQRALLDKLDAQDKPHLVDLMEIELVVLEAEREYLSTLVRERTSFRGRHR